MSKLLDIYGLAESLGRHSETNPLKRVSNPAALPSPAHLSGLARQVMDSRRTQA